LADKRGSCGFSSVVHHFAKLHIHSSSGAALCLDH
jgi:hypothetical protein